MTLAEARANDDAEKIEQLEGAMLELPQVDCREEHLDRKSTRLNSSHT